MGFSFFFFFFFGVSFSDLASVVLLLDTGEGGLSVSLQESERMVPSRV